MESQGLYSKKPESGFRCSGEETIGKGCKREDGSRERSSHRFSAEICVQCGSRNEGLTHILLKWISLFFVIITAELSRVDNLKPISSLL